MSWPDSTCPSYILDPVSTASGFGSVQCPSQSRLWPFAIAVFVGYRILCNVFLGICSRRFGNQAAGSSTPGRLKTELIQAIDVENKLNFKCSSLTIRLLCMELIVVSYLAPGKIDQSSAKTRWRKIHRIRYRGELDWTGYLKMSVYSGIQEFSLWHLTKEELLEINCPEHSTELPSFGKISTGHY